MNPIFLAALTRRIKRRLCICPRCKRRQIALITQGKVRFRCVACGALLPSSNKQK